jgi:hypothetical protein
MMRTIRQEIEAMLSSRHFAAHHARLGRGIETQYCANAATSAEKRARRMIREMHDIPDPPEAPEWLSDEELDDERQTLENAGDVGSARWCDIEAEITARYVATRTSDT